MKKVQTREPVVFVILLTESFKKLLPDSVQMHSAVITLNRHFYPSQLKINKNLIHTVALALKGQLPFMAIFCENLGGCSKEFNCTSRIAIIIVSYQKVHA